MPEPIGLSRNQVWNDLQDPDPFVQPPARSAAAGAAQAPPPSAPSTAPVPNPWLARATSGGASAAQVRPGASPAQAFARSLAQVRAGLDAFATSLCPTVHTANGDVTVQMPFHGPGGVQAPAPGSQELRELLSASVSLGMSGSALHAVLLGHGTPQQLHDLAQGLADMGCVPSDARPGDVRLREMMERHGLGIGTTAYVRQAFLAATGLTATQAHFGSTAMPLQGFARIATSRAQTGDVVVLGRGTQGTSFRAMVYDAHSAGANELAEFSSLVQAERMPASSGRVTVLAVDSSFGPDGDCDSPGVSRTVWYHDEATNVWATMGSPTLVTRGMPFGRPLEGIYRFVGP